MARTAFRHSTLLVLTALAACEDGTNPSQRADLPNKRPVAGVESAEVGVVFVGAGDIAGCDYDRDELTARILDTIPGTVFTAGDNAYEDGTAEEFANCYAPTWGRHQDRTRPTAGNHEYRTDDAAPYYEYFGASAGPAGLGYYSYDLGAWHIVALNSNIDMREGSAQERWLRADLAGRADQCVLAYWHHPRFSSGDHGNDPETAPLVRALYDAGGEIVVSGHDHNYERFAPQTAGGTLDEARGIRQFVVGTGGTDLRRMSTPRSNSEARNDQAHGVLKLTLYSGSYEWVFIPIEGQSYTDTGSGACHGVDGPAPGTGTIDVRIATSADDAEELATGSVALASSDLELVFDAGGNQTVGLRFAAVAIPPSAVITNAYVQFWTDEPNTVATALTIAGEATDHATSFSSSARNISSRSRTSAVVSWAPPSWSSVGEAGPAQRTPNVAAVLQEIVNRPGWASGNALVMTIAGTGERIAAAHDHIPAAAPLLHVEFQTGPTVDAAQSTVTTNVTPVPADGTSAATITVTLLDRGGAPVVGHNVTLAQTGSSVVSDPSGPSDAAGQIRFTVTNTTAETVTYSATDVTDDVTIMQTAQVTFETLPPSTPTAEVLEVRIASGANDAEELATGSMSLASSDLELVFDGGGNQTVGLRFTTVAVPPGAVITNAYVQFQTDETVSLPGTLIIAGQDADNALSFSTASRNISSRPRTAVTVAWAPPVWSTVGEAGPAQRTPNLAAVLQEIVARPGWASGNALVLIITGTGERIAASHERLSAAAPLLHVEFQPALAPPTVDAGLSTVTTNVATVPADGASGATITVTLLDGSGAPVVGHSVTLLQTGSSVISGPSGPSDANGQVTFTVTNTTAEAVTYSATDVHAGVTMTQTAHVTFEASPLPPPPPPPPTTEVIDIRIAASADDVEEFANGDMYRTSVDLELVFDGGGNQTVGLRFAGIAIPRGATITNAYVQFQTDEASTDATALTIAGETTDHATSFGSTARNVSSRPRTAAAVAWVPPGWATVGEAGPAQRTPNLATVLQEIVNRPGWASGNALALIITGTGERVAAAYNGVPSAAPLLHVEFIK